MSAITTSTARAVFPFVLLLIQSHGKLFHSLSNIPAGGFWRDTSHNNVGSWAYYWSTMLNSSSYAWYIRFDSSVVKWDDYDQMRGFSIRSTYSDQIFTPAGGECSDTHERTGSFGYYWSNIYSDLYFSDHIFFGSNNLDLSFAFRYLGYSIRSIRPLEW